MGSMLVCDEQVNILRIRLKLSRVQPSRVEIATVTLYCISVYVYWIILVPGWKGAPDRIVHVVAALTDV